jgi:hypothetical protein
MQLVRNRSSKGAEDISKDIADDEDLKERQKCIDSSLS